MFLRYIKIVHYNSSTSQTAKQFYDMHTNKSVIDLITRQTRTHKHQNVTTLIRELQVNTSMPHYRRQHNTPINSSQLYSTPRDATKFRKWLNLTYRPDKSLITTVGTKTDLHKHNETMTAALLNELL